MKTSLKYWLLFLFPLTISSNIFAQQISTSVQEPDKQYLSIIGFSVLGFILGAVFVYLYSRLRIYSILKDEKTKYISSLKGKRHPYLFKYIELVGELKRSKDEKKNEIQYLEKSSQKQKNKINQESDTIKTGSELMSKPDEKKLAEIKEVPAIEEDSKSATIELKIEPQILKTIELYFTIPEKDGSFRLENSKSKKDDNCFYKIIPENGKQKAAIHFITGNSDLRALDNIDFYLNPVCEIQNITNRTQAQKIKMIAPGIVYLNGENWEIDSKNKVKIQLI